MKLTFGKHKGKDLYQVPRDYLDWLANPKQFKDGKEYNIPPDVIAAAITTRGNYDLASDLLTGKPQLDGLSIGLDGPFAKLPYALYITESFGDIANPHYNGGFKAGFQYPRVFISLHYALQTIEEWAFVTDTETGVKRLDNLDPEDDRLLVWEVLPSGHRKVVWQFAGWHWNPEDYACGQSSFPGHTKTAYQEAMEE